MGRIVDTTNHVNVTIDHKSKLTKNFSSDNYWIESYQNKINQAWRFATDVVDVGEQQIEFNNESFVKARPVYKDLEVRITSAYDEKGKKLSDDYKDIIFKDVNHKQRLGQKFLFDPEDFTQTQEDRKSTWLTINFDRVKIGANSIIRKCNAMTGFLVNDKIEWYEPTILDYDATYTINYYNDVLNTVKSEVYATLQLNEYTNLIKVNDRFIYGILDFNNPENNVVYIVKELFKMGSIETGHPNDVPLLILALDRDVINTEDDYIRRDEDGTIHYIANYYTKKKNKESSPLPVLDDQEWYLQISPDVNTIRQGDNIDFEIGIFKNEILLEDIPLEVSIDLPDCPRPNLYFKYTPVDDRHFNIECKKKYFKQKLIIKITAPEEYELDPLDLEILLDAPLEV